MTTFEPLAGAVHEMRTLLYSHDTFGLGHLRRSRTIATALVDAGVTDSALIVTGSPIAGRFDFPACVDHVRLPGVVKHADGSYSSLNLRMDIDAMVSLRRGLIDAAEHEFRPDLVIVDKEPWGFRHELAGTLAAARARGARIVLGLRDVLDEDEAVAEEWARKNALEAIEAFYDEIWVYGMPQISRPLAGLGLSRRMEDRIVYTGYLRRELPDWPAEPDGDVPRQPYILVTTGGGGDGGELVDWVVRAYESGARQLPRAVIVTGPFMPPADQQRFHERCEALPQVEILTFDSHIELLMQRALGIVAMGGYNTFCEILTLDKPALLVPRSVPRQEQLIRAERALQLGLIRMLDPSGERGADEMAAALAELPYQPKPSARRVEGLLSGHANIAEMVHLYLDPKAQHASLFA